MKATSELKEEHQAIKRMLKVVKAVGQKLAADEAVPPEHLEEVVAFLRGYADRFHHAKEENLLFSAMGAAGIPRDGGPIAVMLDEHGEGRGYVSDMAEAAAKYKKGDRGAGRGFFAAACAYVDLLAQHIDKEDNVLYVMADRVLSAAAQKELEEGFARVERERVAAGKQDEYRRILEKLAGIYGVP